MDGLVLRYGFFYGPGTYYAPDGHTAGEVRKRRYPVGPGMASSPTSTWTTPHPPPLPRSSEGRRHLQRL